MKAGQYYVYVYTSILPDEEGQIYWPAYVGKGKGKRWADHSRSEQSAVYSLIQAHAAAGLDMPIEFIPALDEIDARLAAMRPMRYNKHEARRFA